MTCPHCSATVQPGDQFCMSCGHAMNPADPTRRLDNPVEPVYSAEPAPQRAPYLQPVPPPQPRYAPSPNYGRQGDRDWSSGSGSSHVPPNPYASPPNQGTILNGQPIGGIGGRRGANNGLLQGLGAAIVALFVILGKFGGAIAGLGFFKLFFLFSLFRWFGQGHSWVLILVVLLIVGAIYGAQRS